MSRMHSAFPGGDAHPEYWKGKKMTTSQKFNLWASGFAANASMFLIERAYKGGGGEDVAWAVALAALALLNWRNSRG